MAKIFRKKPMRVVPQPDQEQKPDGEKKQSRRGKKLAGKVLRRFVTAILTLALIIGAILVVIYHDQLNVDSVKRFLAYQNLNRDESGQAEEIFFENDSSNCFAQLDNSLIVASSTSLTLTSQSGTQYVEETVSFANPAAYAKGSYGVAYDLGGTDFYLFAGKTLAAHGQTEGSILSARVNSNGYLTIVSQAQGYKGVTTVYDAGASPIVQENISSAYVLDAQVSDSGRVLAMVTMGEEDGAFTCTIGFYQVSTGELTTSYEIYDQLVLDLNWDNGGLWVQTDQGVCYMTVEEGVTGSWVNSSGYLRGFDNGSNCQVMYFSTYQTGTRGTIVVVDANGNQLASLDVTEEVQSISAADGYVAVLFANRLEIYTNQLELYDALQDTAGARQVMVRKDGTVLLVGSKSATVYVP